MEIRAILLVVLVILAGFVLWWGVHQEEKRSYLGGGKLERIPTAAGQPTQP